MSSRGQLSAEMLILLAVILAVLVLVASQLMKTSKDAAVKIDQRANETFNLGDQTANANARASSACVVDRDCPVGQYCSASGTCIS